MSKLDEHNWYFIVRIDTSERLVNKSGDINVCKAYHLPRILAHLNRHSEVWEGMSVFTYKELFGEYMNCNINYCAYTNAEEESEYYD